MYLSEAAGSFHLRPAALAAAQQGSLLNEYWVYLRAAVLAAALGSILATGTGQMALDTVLGITLSITQVQQLP